jgi:flagellar hook-associated protein FlgK
MPSSFFGLYVQREALLIAQKSLDIVGNNISNINTKGYTRQRVDVASIANSKGGLLSNTAIGLAGQGVRGVGVAQIRDMLLDKKFRTYTSDAMHFGTKVKVMSDVETALDNIESDSSGFNKVLSDFKAALQGFTAENANRREIATIAQSGSKAVIDYLGVLNARLTDLSTQTQEDASIAVDRVNAILAEMGDLNKQITDAYVNMHYLTMQGDGYKVQSDYGPLELKDKFNLLLDELSQYGNIDFKEEYNGSITVWFAGQHVVDNKFYAQVAMVNKQAVNPDFQPNPAVTDPPYDPKYYLKFAYKDENGARTYINEYDYAALQARAAGGDAVAIAELEKFNASLVEDPNGDIAIGGTMYSLRSVDFSKPPESGTIETPTGPVISTGNPYDPRTAPDPLYMGIVITDYKMETSDWSVLAPSPKERQYFVMNQSNGSAYTSVTDGQRFAKIGFTDVTTLRDGSGRELLYAGAIRAYLDTFNGNGDFANVNYPNEDGRDPNPIGNNEYRGIEYYRNMLNAFSQTFTKEMNGIFAEWGFNLFEYDGMYLNLDESRPENEYAVLLRNEYVLKYNQRNGTTFTEDAAGYLAAYNHAKNTNFADIDAAYNHAFQNIASTMRVSEAWMSDPVLISKPYWAPTQANMDRFGWASIHPTDAEKAAADEFLEYDNSWIHKMLGAFETTHGYSNLPIQPITFQKFMQHIGDTLGQQVAYETQVFETGDIMLQTVETARDAVMGVAMDEEGIDMMNYQKWYNAIARMTTALDEALDTLINRTGRVGL